MIDWNFTLANYDTVWGFMVQVGLLMIALLCGNILRTAVPFLRRGLVPSALIGGFVLLLLNIVLRRFGFPIVNKRAMQIITYHGLAIGFIAMTLKTIRTKSRAEKTKVLENSALTGGTYMLQAFAGLLVSIAFYWFTKNKGSPDFYASGVILPLGFGQGPGNALAWDINFSGIVKDGARVFTGGGSFGLSIASIGFVVASVFGVAYINIFKRGEMITLRTKSAEEKSVSHYEDANEIEDNESVDKFSIQLSFVFLAYAISFAIMVSLSALGQFVNNIVWGFNFIWGIIAASLVKFAINSLKKTGVVKKNYVNNYQMDRISGFAFDIMIVAGVAAIEIEDVRRYAWLLAALCVVGAIATCVYVRLVTRHCFEGYEHEMFVMNFGTLTGTASNGMILLKEIDPDYSTNTSSLFVLSQFPSIIMVAPLLLLLNFCASSFRNCLISTGIFFALWLVYTVFLFRDKFCRKKFAGAGGSVGGGSDAAGNAVGEYDSAQKTRG